MAKRRKVMGGAESFYSKLAVYLHIYKHKSQANLAKIFGVSRSTIGQWVMEFNRSRLESILKNFEMMGGELTEALEAGGDTIEEIRQVLIRQAKNGSIAAAKIVLELERAEGDKSDPNLTVEDAIELLRQWDGPRQCSQCGHVDAFKYARTSALAQE